MLMSQIRLPCIQRQTDRICRDLSTVTFFRGAEWVFLLCRYVDLAFSLHNSAYPGECTGVLLTKISVFSSINSSSGGPAPRRMSMPQLSSGPTLYPCITHACCCHYNSFPLPSPGHYLCTPVAPCARDSSIYPGLLQQEGLKASVLPVRTQPVHTVPLQKQMAATPSY